MPSHFTSASGPGSAGPRAVPLDRASAASTAWSRKFTDFALGARLAVRGGGESWVRSLLTAVGVALTVMMLLFASAVPTVVSKHQARDNAVAFNFGGTSPRYYEISQQLSFDGHQVGGIVLQPLSASAAPPPGVKKVLEPGQVVVSPALAKLLRTDRAGTLQTMLGGRVIGEIGELGLTGPNELKFYRGSKDVGIRGGTAILGFGVSGNRASGAGPQEQAILTLLDIVLVVGLLAPLALFVITASRFGSERRSQRLAAVRLLGADRAMTARIASGETLPGVMLGMVLGAGMFYLLRPLTQRIDLLGVSAFTSDVRPETTWLVLIAVLVPVCALLSTFSAMRQLASDPISATLKRVPPRRRIGWRLGLTAVGFLMLAPLATSRAVTVNSYAGSVLASLGVFVVLVGVAALTPWLVEWFVGHTGTRGHAAWLLAVRRLRFAPGTAGRTVAVIALAVAGAVALQVVFTSVNARQQRRDLSSANTSVVGGTPVSIYTILAKSPSRLVGIENRFASLAGFSRGTAVGWAINDREERTIVVPCRSVRGIPEFAGCSDGSAYIEAGGQLRPGQVLRDHGLNVRVPLDAKSIALRQAMNKLYERLNSYGVPSTGKLVLTPKAAERAGLGVLLVQGAIVAHGQSVALEQRLDYALSRVDPDASNTYSSYVSGTFARSLAELNDLLEAGALVVLLVIAASLLVATADQLRERRRIIAALGAIGTPGRTLALSFVWQIAIPLALGTILAVVLGLALGGMLVAITGQPLVIRYGAILALAGAGIVLVFGVTLASLPLLGRQMRPAALRTE